jgi:SpoVK/Ycf46/Vps4 family AAA+-type ATPase
MSGDKSPFREILLYSVGIVVAASVLGVAYVSAAALQDRHKRQRLAHKYPYLKRTDFTPDEEELLDAVVAPGSISTTLRDIGGLQLVKQEILESVILPFRRPELFRSPLLSPFSGVLLFGPPGTGKTLLAKAIAHECGACFINVDVSTLKSKWFGESEARVVALFSLARKLEPSIIFIDEIDALLSRRDDSSDIDVVNSVKAGIMTAWSGLTSDTGARVIVVAATNRPAAIDAAVMRRLPRKFHVALPDADAREAILRLFVGRAALDADAADADAADAADAAALSASLPDVNCKLVARLTEGFSGSDLENLCKTAMMQVLREYLQQETSFNAGLTTVTPTMRALGTRDLVESIGKIVTQAQNAELGVYI